MIRLSDGWSQGDLARRVTTEVFGPPSQRPFAIRYWDGSWEPGAAGPLGPFTLCIRHPGALRAMLLPPSELAFAEAFLRNDIDFEGNLEAAAPVARTVVERLCAPRRLVRLASLLRRLPCVRARAASPLADRARPGGRRHSRSRDAAAIRHHYDVGNEFFQLWLDSQSVYSCGYFAPGTEDLEAAQRAKLDYICRKLRLRPGERLAGHRLRVGCAHPPRRALLRRRGAGHHPEPRAGPAGLTADRGGPAGRPVSC